MKHDDQARKGSPDKARHRHERWRNPTKAAPVPRSWTNKSMHHPATRIGEIKHGKT